MPEYSALSYTKTIINPLRPSPLESDTPVPVTLIPKIITPAVYSPRHHNSQGTAPFVLNARQIALGYLHNYFLARLDEPIRILIDEAETITDFPTKGPDDFELLRMISSTLSARRWWRISVNDLVCADCVQDLKDREAIKCEARMVRNFNWLFLIGSLGFEGNERSIATLKRALSSPTDSPSGSDCGHGSMATSNVTRFVMQFGMQNTKNFSNIELDIPLVVDELKSIDLEVLICAVRAFKTHFRDVQQLRVIFHFPKAHPLEMELKIVGRVVENLRKLEDMLPNESRRMTVVGLEHHYVMRKAWDKAKKRWNKGDFQRLPSVTMQRYPIFGHWAEVVSAQSRPN